MPTIQELATEFGIDLSTAKPEFFTKANGYLSDAATQFSTATQLKKDAEANLQRVQEERKEIDDYIANYGTSEQTIAALQANNAAQAAALKVFKDQGFPVDIPNAPIIPNKTDKTPVFNAAEFQGRVSSAMAEGFNLSNKYLALTGKALPDNIEALASEAAQARKPLMQYASEKYGFADIEKRNTEAAQKTHDDQVAAAAVKKYQDEHPANTGNPFQDRGVDSRHTQIFKPREAGDLKRFAGLSAREKIAQSVARSRELATANQA